MVHLSVCLKKVLMVFLITALSYSSTGIAVSNYNASQVQSGDSLINILRKYGFSDHERETVLGNSQQLRNIFLTLDTKYLVRKNANGVELCIYDSQTSAAFRITKHKDQIKVEPYEPKYKITLQRIEGKVNGSILGSVLAKIDSNFVASRFNDAYAFDISSVRELKRGARFWFTVQKKYDNGMFIKYGEISQTSLEIDGKELQKKFIRGLNGGVFFNSEDLLEKRPLYSPVNYLKIASGFQPNRLHPITGRVQPHLGVDFELPTGEPVFAPRQGVVVRFGHHHAAGNFIVLMHSNGMETSYNHLNRIEKRIHRGLKVLAGEKIAEVGCTGYCTRAHLHFAVKNRGHMVNPINYIKSYPYKMERQLAARVVSNDL